MQRETTGGPTVRVMVTDDHRLVLESLVHVLDEHPSLQVVATARCAEELLRLLAGGQRADVCVIDLSMPGLGGAEAVREISTRPDAPRCVVLTASASPAVAHNAVACGATGLVGKSRSPSELIDAIIAAASGRQWLDPDLLPEQPGPASPEGDLLDRLTPREFDVFVRLARGQRINDIAGDLFLSPKTVSTHRRRILDKLERRTNVELARIALDRGLLDPM